MLSHNLLYTRLTQTEHLAILVKLKQETGLAVQLMKAQERYTLLRQWLSEL